MNSNPKSILCTFLRFCRRSLVGAAVGIGLTLPLVSAWANPVELDRIVAVVNQSVITRHQLDARVAQTIDQLRRQNTPPPPRRVLERQLLERMITERVLLQIAEETNIRVDGAPLDRAVASLAARNGMDLPTFRAAIEADGVRFEDFRAQLRQQMIFDRLREREVDSKVTVSDAEIDLFLANQAREAGPRVEYNLAHLLVLTPEGASPEALAQLRAKAERARAELRAGAPLAQVSAAYSDAPNALQGGSLGWRNEDKLPALFVEAARNLRVGEVSEVIRSPNGFHVLVLLDKRGRDVPTVVRQTHARHILIRTNEVVGDQEARKRLMDLRERIVHGEDFARLARLHSDDLSASKGGDLGWLNPGDTVPDFERAMDALQPGEVSEPVRSPFGWHLVQVIARRDQDVTDERRRIEARRALHERKSEEAFEDWVRQARDRAYVEIRLDD